MSTNKEYYRLGVKTLDAAILLVNDVVPLVNQKILGYVDMINSLISAGKIDDLKKKAPVLVDPIKNYTILSTSLNNVIANSHTINYARKSILKALISSKKDTEKVKEYITEKGKILDEDFMKALEHLKIIEEALSNFSNVFPAKKQDNSSDKKIKDVEDVVVYLKKLLVKLELYSSDIKAETKRILSSISSEYEKAKKGKYEDVLKDYNRLTGGYEKTDNSNKIRIYGSSDIIVGGGKAESKINKLAIFCSNWISDSSDEDFDQEKYIRNVISSELEDLFNVKIGSSEEIVTLLESNLNLTNRESLSDNLNLQLSSIEKSNILSQFKEYLKVHCKKYKVKYLVEDISTGSSDKTENSKSIPDRCEQIINVCDKLLQQLDEIDKIIVTSEAKKTFQFVRNIDTKEEFNVCLDNLDNSMETLRKNKDLLFNRKNMKILIQDSIKHIRKILSNMKSSENSASSEVFEKTDKKPLATNSFQGAMDKIIKTTEKVIQNSSGMVQSDKQIEYYNDNIAAYLGKLCRAVELLISPENTTTCIKKTTNVINSLITCEMMSRSASKLSSKNADKSNVIKKKIDDYKDEIMKIIPIKSQKSIYNNGLSVETINEMYNSISGLVDQ